METVPSEIENIDIEIIDFYRPYDNKKTIYITKIPGENTSECDIYTYLYSKFSEFGLIYDIRIFTSSVGQTESNEEAVKTKEGCTDSLDRVSSYYAFVNFFSCFSAAKAKKKLCGRLFLGGHHLKMKYATRKKRLNGREPLYYTKCYDVANYYLGFNGWSSAVMSLQERKSDAVDERSVVVLCFECQVALSIARHGLSCFGSGSSFQYWDKTNLGSRSAAVCHAKKQAYQLAVQDAFSKLLIVITSNGKVHLEIDTTVDQHYDTKELSGILPVNVRDGEEEIPESSAEENDLNDYDTEYFSKIDESNRRILAELETTDD